MSYKPSPRGFPGGASMAMPPSMSNPMPVIASTGDEDEEIRLLTEQLQYELGSLSSTHSVLEQDMQRLASMLSPYMTPAGRLNLPDNGQLDSKILLFKQGLDFRISEYNEDCKRLEQVQSRLQRKLEEAAGSYERTFMGVSGLADARIIRRLEELQRVITVQQHELDQARFERDVVADESKRLRQMFIRNGPSMAQQSPLVRQEPFSAGIGSLHVATAAKFVPMAGPSMAMSSNPRAQPANASVPFPVPSPVSVAPSAAKPAEEASWGGWWNGAPAGSTSSPPAARRDFL